MSWGPMPAFLPRRRLDAWAKLIECGERDRRVIGKIVGMDYLLSGPMMGRGHGADHGDAVRRFDMDHGIAAQTHQDGDIEPTYRNRVREPRRRLSSRLLGARQRVGIASAPVMYPGMVAEIGPIETVVAAPRHLCADALVDPLPAVVTVGERHLAARRRPADVP